MTASKSPFSTAVGKIRDRVVKMSNRKETMKKTFFCTFAATLLVVSVPFQTAVAVDRDEDTSSPSDQYSERFIGSFSTQDTESLGATRSFLFPSGGLVTAHNPHRSPGKNEASGHVTWKPVGNPRFTTMRLTARLYAKRGTRFFAVGIADTRDSKPALKGQTPGANARVSCESSKSTMWYTLGSGYAPGVQKTHGKHKSAESDVHCWPWARH